MRLCKESSYLQSNANSVIGDGAPVMREQDDLSDSQTVDLALASLRGKHSFEAALQYSIATLAWHSLSMAFPQHGFPSGMVFSEAWLSP